MYLCLKGKLKGSITHLKNIVGVLKKRHCNAKCQFVKAYYEILYLVQLFLKHFLSSKTRVETLLSNYTR